MTGGAIDSGDTPRRPGVARERRIARANLLEESVDCGVDLVGLGDHVGRPAPKVRYSNTVDSRRSSAATGLGLAEALPNRDDARLVDRTRRTLRGRVVAAIDSTVSPMNSTRRGSASPGGNTSTMPPRTQNSPCSSTGSSRVNPASTSCSASNCGPISTPAVRSTEAEASCAGGTSRGSSAAAEITTTRACPRRFRERAGTGGRHLQVRRQPAIRDRLRGGQRDDGVGQGGFAKSLERVEEVPGIGGHLLHVGIGGHDHDGELVRCAVGAQRDVQGAGRRRQA